MKLIWYVVGIFITELQCEDFDICQLTSDMNYLPFNQPSTKFEPNHKTRWDLK